MPPSNVSRRAWWRFLVLLLAGLPIYFFVTSGTLQGLLYDAYGLSSAAAIIVATRVHRTVTRGPWLAFAGGLLLFAIGDVLFNIWTIDSDPIAFPSIADYLYLAAYPVLALGFLLLVRRRTPVSGARWMA